jgi:hypothetical protein
MNKVCAFFEKEHAFFDENFSQTIHIEKLEGCINNNNGKITINQEKVITEIKNLFAENKLLKNELEVLKNKMQ